MRILLFTGKGGVGKTTVAAATAVRAAEAGLRTIVLSTDPAHSLADAFDAPLGDQPTPIREHLFGQQLNARVRFEEAWSEVRTYLVDVLDWAGADAVEAEELAVIPGLDEVFALADIKQFATSGDYDVVVVDCAPTAETIRLLSLPDVLGWYMERVFDTQRRLTRLARPIVQRMSGIPIAADGVFGAMRRFYDRLDGVREILTDGDITSARLVLNPERLVVAEAAPHVHVSLAVRLPRRRSDREPHLPVGTRPPVVGAVEGRAVRAPRGDRRRVHRRADSQRRTRERRDRRPGRVVDVRERPVLRRRPGRATLVLGTVAGRERSKAPTRSGSRCSFRSRSGATYNSDAPTKSWCSRSVRIGARSCCPTAWFGASGARGSFVGDRLVVAKDPCNGSRTPAAAGRRRDRAFVERGARVPEGHARVGRRGRRVRHRTTRRRVRPATNVRRGCTASTSTISTPTSPDVTSATLGLDIGGTKVLGVLLDADGTVLREARLRVTARGPRGARRDRRVDRVGTRRAWCAGRCRRGRSRRSRRTSALRAELAVDPERTVARRVRGRDRSSGHHRQRRGCRNAGRSDVRRRDRIARRAARDARDRNRRRHVARRPHVSRRPQLRRRDRPLHRRRERTAVRVRRSGALGVDRVGHCARPNGARSRFPRWGSRDRGGRGWRRRGGYRDSRRRRPRPRATPTRGISSCSTPTTSRSVSRVWPTFSIPSASSSAAGSSRWARCCSARCATRSDAMSKESTTGPPIPILPAQLGERAGAIGAAILARSLLP